MAMEKLNIAVFGASGFIGKHLVKYFSRKKNVNILIFSGNLLKKQDLEIFFSKNKSIDCVVNLVGKFYGNFEELIKINLVTLDNLLNFCMEKNIKNFIYLSSSAVYGNSIDAAKETDLLLPDTSYALVKNYCEELILFYNRKYNFLYKILRPVSVFGKDNNKGVIFSFLKNIKKNKCVQINGSGNQIRNFIPVEDLCIAIEKSIFYEKSNIFNISTSKTYSINDVAELLKQKYDFKVEHRYTDEKSISSNLDNEKAMIELNFISEGNLSQL
jgi:nucleoside-diphosphate-sugar epimerase